MSVQDDEAHRRVIFRDWDGDKNGFLNRTEMHAMIGGTWNMDDSFMIQHERDMVIYQVPFLVLFSIPSFAEPECCAYLSRCASN